MEPMISKVLERAAEHVEKGWCRGQLGLLNADRTGWTMPIMRKFQFDRLPEADRVCLDGAVILATHEVLGIPLKEVTEAGAYQVVARALHATLRETWDWTGSYVQWNDLMSRTPDQVAALLRETAKA